MKPRATRITEQELIEQKVRLLAESSLTDTGEGVLKAKPAKKKSDKPAEKQDYLGSVFFLDGNAWLDIDGDTRIIGTEKEVRAAIKMYEIDPNEPSRVKNALVRYRRENTSPSYQSVSDCPAPCPITPGVEINRIKCESTPPENRTTRLRPKDDPMVINIIKDCISRDLGTPRTQEALQGQGYDIPYATVGRLIKKERENHG